MKQVIHTNNAPKAIGPYSQAILAGNTLYISGQIAINPTSNELELSSIEVEATQVMNNLKAILVAAGFGLEHVVKCTILLSSMDHYATVNEVYGSFFSTNYPAREAFAVLTLPKNVNVEISAIAVK